MAEFINREELLKDIDDSVRFSTRNGVSAELRGAHKIVDCIRSAPSADVVEVIRCSECQHWGGVTYGFVCRKFSGENTKICMHADGFCSYGERRSENERPQRQMSRNVFL